MQRLRDGDLASNQLNWQWVAGCGADAAPYFRVFNPVKQGQKLDYVRAWIPELRHLPGAAAHVPWDVPEGYAHRYPRRIVDHATERREALRRLEQVRALSRA
jgi:deoxyribodipyrimidine photo-lyase